MENIKVNIKNCYGINSLECEFDFTNKKSSQIIYAPNGVMKTSFAKVFDDYCNNQESKDLMFPENESVREIFKSTGGSLNTESVFVIKSYEETFKSDKMSTLLVRDDLRKEYDEVYQNIDSQKEKLFKLLKEISGLNKNIEEILCMSFGEKNVLKVLSTLEEVVKEDSESQFGNIIYNKIFNDKVIQFLETDDIKNQIKLYIQKYDELISKSTIFKKDFNHYNANTVQRSLMDNGFFKAEHSINLNINGEKQEMKSQSELLKVIKSAKEEILKDTDLQLIFNKIDKKITNAQLREFRDYLFENQEILTELTDLTLFRQKLWISYLKRCKESYVFLIEEYKKGQSKIKEIVDKARSEETDWENVINIFNNRFYVPYSLGIANKEDTILRDKAPSIEYYFDKRSDKVEEDLLLRVLSQGEKRTLYLLNIIFEIESRKKTGIKTLFIIDDIADSFDYKNKYAIVEYLKEISEYPNFYSIILTHNFDFFRTAQERIIGAGSRREASFMAVKETERIRLEKLEYRYISNPFKNWKNDLNNKPKLIASITFVRNIVEYIGDDEVYDKLTSLLHFKESTTDITINDLQKIYSSVFRNLGELDLDDRDKKVFDIIFAVADNLSKSDSESINLENKVVLSIAIRLTAEMFMINRIDDIEYVLSLKGNQTGKLLRKFKKCFPNDQKSLDVLEKVNIMTPENIHLNSFMFEPILDLSDKHLKQLFKEVTELYNKLTLSQVAATIVE